MLNFDRIINILIRPQQEWQSISEEQYSPVQILWRYFIPLLLIPVIALVFGYGLLGKANSDGFISFVIKGWDVGFQKSLIYLISAPIALFLSAWVIDHMAPVFRSERNLDRTLILLGYASTPVLLTGVFYLLPVLDFMFIPGFIASFVVLWFGIPVFKSTPKASISAYFLSMVVLIVSILALVHLIVKSLMGAIWVNESTLLIGAITL